MLRGLSRECARCFVAHGSVECAGRARVRNSMVLLDFAVWVCRESFGAHQLQRVTDAKGFELALGLRGLDVRGLLAKRAVRGRRWACGLVGVRRPVARGRRCGLCGVPRGSDLDTLGHQGLKACGSTLGTLATRAGRARGSSIWSLFGCLARCHRQCGRVLDCEIGIRERGSASGAPKSQRTDVIHWWPKTPWPSLRHGHGSLFLVAVPRCIQPWVSRHRTIQFALSLLCSSSWRAWILPQSLFRMVVVGCPVEQGKPVACLWKLMAFSWYGEALVRGRGANVGDTEEKGIEVLKESKCERPDV